MKTKVLRFQGSKTTPYRVISPPGFGGNPDRQYKYFATKADAQAFADMINRYKDDKKRPFDTTIRVDESDLKWLSYLKTGLGGDLSKIPTVLAHYFATGANIVETSIESAVSQYLAYENGGKLSAGTLNDIRSRLNQLSGAFNGRLVSSITADEMTAYIATYKSEANKERHYIRCGKFFTFCLERKLIAVNPLTTVRKPQAEVKEAEIYSVRDIEKILQATDKYAPELLAGFICELYGFVRTQEVKKMDWADINFREVDGYIHVRTDVAKKTPSGRKERYIPLCEVLRHWLGPIAKANGPIVPEGYEAKKVVEKAGVTFSPNAFRHSAISYTISAQDNPEIGINMVNKWSGHGETVCRSNYLRSVDPAEAKRFLSLRRATSVNPS